MPILTKNQTPAKGQKAEFELDKSALAAIVSNLYFQDSDISSRIGATFLQGPHQSAQKSISTRLLSLMTSSNEASVTITLTPHGLASNSYMLRNMYIQVHGSLSIHYKSNKILDLSQTTDLYVCNEACRHRATMACLTPAS